jgi:fused signal recognition particle receptor
VGGRARPPHRRSATTTRTTTTTTTRPRPPRRPTAPRSPRPSSDATDAYRAGLAKTRGGFVAKLGKLFGKKKIDEDVLPALEEVLFTADIGPRAADRIFESVKKSLSKDDLENADKIWDRIRWTSTQILDVGAPALDWSAKRPTVLLVLGVNGSGKTTTIGKLAAQLKGQGKKVLLGAGDTFRAAAADQLEVWAGRAEVPIVTGPDGGDPSSVLLTPSSAA